jgi:DNA-binding response OmpR family regulator
VPVVVMSGLDSPQDRMRIKEAGFAGRLTKPIDLRTLAIQLSRILGSSRLSLSQEDSACVLTGS